MNKLSMRDIMQHGHQKSSRAGPSLSYVQSQSMPQFSALDATRLEMIGQVSRPDLTDSVALSAAF